MRWSHEEENRSKQRELDHLKAEIHHIHLIKAESLESQRRDLTTTFEGLLQQREDAYITKEKEIADQVMLLDNRFNQLHNTNIKLKNELRDATHQIEKLTEEVGMKEEQRRKVEWLLDDERASRHLLDNQLQRKYDELLLNYTNAAENHNKDNKKNQHLLDQV